MEYKPYQNPYPYKQYRPYLPQLPQLPKPIVKPYIQPVKKEEEEVEEAVQQEEEQEQLEDLEELPVEPKEKVVEQLGTSKHVGVRLPLELYNLIKDNPTERIRFAIKKAYGYTK